MQERSKGILSSDSYESSFMEQNLTQPMKEIQTRDLQDEVIEISKDAMNSPRITELTVTMTIVAAEVERFNRCRLSALPPGTKFPCWGPKILP